MSKVPGTPAATVILVRDGADELEVLLLSRHTDLDFAGGMAVFPGGRIDAEDWDGVEPDDELGAARRGAAREAAEEVGVVVDPDALVPYAHWSPPLTAPRRFTTWFFVAPTPGGDITVDGSEIVDHVWLPPAEALARHGAGRLELLPPTWITLHSLARHADVASVMAAATALGEGLPRYVSAMVSIDGGLVALWDGDVAYEDLDAAADRPGPRHRLWMSTLPWRFEGNLPG